ncbi:DUF6984 family protein [Ekhidna sp.]
MTSKKFIQSTRKLKTEEIFLLEKLILKSGENFENWEFNTRAIDMNDDGMGSIRLISNDTNDSKRQFGKRVSELMYDDSDGVRVIFSLHLDGKGMLFELDIWKTDFNELKTYPSSSSDFT